MIWALTVIDYPACKRAEAIYARCESKQRALAVAARLADFASQYVANERRRMPFRGVPRKTKVLGRFPEMELLRRLLAQGINLIGRAVQVEDKKSKILI